MRALAACIAWALLAVPGAAYAQEFMIRGFGDAGATVFAAEQSFEAILGSKTGKVFGGGLEVVFPARVFAGARASRFRETGQRVFLFEGERFDLGIPATISITAVELTAGYRLPSWRRLVPYGGAGAGVYRLEETSSFSAEGENVDTRYTGYHVLGGAEVAVLRWLAVGGEVQWATVPDAIGGDPNSVSHAFDESDLGGVALRVRVVVGM